MLRTWHLARMGIFYKVSIHIDLLVSFGCQAVKHPALGAEGHRFDPSKRSKLFQGLISWLTTS